MTAQLVFEQDEDGEQKMTIQRDGSADPDEFLRKAKSLTAFEFNERFPVLEGGATLDEFYIVWFSKVLGNWKALVSTDLVSGFYWEVTYNGNREESYVDCYTKANQLVVTDAFIASLP